MFVLFFGSFYNWILLGHLKVRSASIAAFRISLAISPHFVWISSKNFSFFNVSHKSLSFTTWNLIEYLHTQDFQRATAHLNVWANIWLFCFVYGCKTTHKNILTGSKSKKLAFTLGSPQHFKPYLLICGLILLKLLSFLLYFFFLYWIHK